MLPDLMNSCPNNVPLVECPIMSQSNHVSVVVYTILSIASSLTVGSFQLFAQLPSILESSSHSFQVVSSVYQIVSPEAQPSASAMKAKASSLSVPQCTDISSELMMSKVPYSPSSEANMPEPHAAYTSRTSVPQAAFSDQPFF